MTMADATRYTDLCRICGEKTTDMLAVNIFENEGTVRQLDKKIEECLPVQVHEADQLPKMICEQCVYKLDLFFDFRERALRTENLLIHLYKQFTPAQAEQLKMEELMLVQQHHLLNEVSELELNQLEHRDSMIVDQQIIDMNGHTLSGIELSHPELIKSLNSHPIVQGNMLVSSANVMQSHRYAEDLLHQDHQMAYTTQTYSLNDITLSSDAIQDKHINQDIQDVLVVETNLQKSIDQNQRIDKREFEIDVSESQILGESYKQQEYVKQEDSNSECRLLIDEPQPTLFVGVDCDNGQEENDVDDDFSQPELEMCNICKTSVVKDEFNAHYKQHFVKCIVCSAVLPNKEALDAHSKDVHGDTVEKIKVEMTDVPYFSDTELHNEEPPKRPKRAIPKIWKYECTFANEQEALDFIKTEYCWSLKNTNHNVKGTIKYYRCNKVKARGDQCRSGLKLIFDPKCTEVVLHRLETDHNCDRIATKAGVGISEEIKTDIEDMFRKKFKPRAILDMLIVKYKLPPNIVQVSNYLAQLKRRRVLNYVTEVKRHEYQ